jgi:hypothetical protein
MKRLSPRLVAIYRPLKSLFSIPVELRTHQPCFSKSKALKGTMRAIQAVRHFSRNSQIRVGSSAQRILPRQKQRTMLEKSRLSLMLSLAVRLTHARHILLNTGRKYPNQLFTAFISKIPADQFSNAMKVERRSQDADLQTCLQDAKE